jgi:ABC-type nickel/cobalt efflux system permease component RcnA
MLQRKASEEFVPLEQLCSLSNAATAYNESSIQHHSQQHYQQQLQQQQHHQLQQLPNEQHEQSTCSREHRHPVNQTYELALYGWRKKCLYIFMGFVTLAILINALLTLWIIDILCFSMVSTSS